LLFFWSFLLSFFLSFRINPLHTYLYTPYHLLFGVPTNHVNATNELLLVNQHYLIHYDKDLLVPIWAAHKLTNTDIVSLDRVDSFRTDPKLTTNSSACIDYKKDIFDQEHVVPRGDMNRSTNAMINTFLMSNMTPQHCAFNHGVWRVLEGAIRNL